MSLWLITMLLTSPAPTEIVFRDTFNAADVVFEDVTGDGITDVWLKTDADVLWVHDGADPNPEARRVDAPRAPFPVWPRKSDEAWYVMGFADGVFYRCVDGEIWEMHWDLGSNRLIRNGMPLLRHGPRTLIPTVRGYLIAQDQCSLATWQVSPIISIKKRWMAFTYPIPAWRSARQEGHPSLRTPPVVSAWQSKIIVHDAMRSRQGWEFRKASSHFPPQLRVSTHAWGLLNDDDYPDLAILAMPQEEFSVFDELSFLIYLGNGPHSLQPHPHQVLETKQNLWQSGPIAIRRPHLIMFYYKGLIRSKFRIDRYAWDASGFVRPKPDETSWKMKRADRSTILIDHDLDGDQVQDLLLSDERGLCLVPGRLTASGALEYDDEHLYVISPEHDSEMTVTINVGPDRTDFSVTSGSLGVGRRHGGPGIILEPGNDAHAARLWHFFEDIRGIWRLRPLDLPTATH